MHPPGVYQAVAQNINTHTAGQIVVIAIAVAVVVAVAVAVDVSSDVAVAVAVAIAVAVDVDVAVSFIVKLEGIESACTHPPSEMMHPPGFYQAVIQNINIHAAAKLILVVVLLLLFVGVVVVSLLVLNKMHSLFFLLVFHFYCLVGW
jgi:hypothetical protein